MKIFDEITQSQTTPEGTGLRAIKGTNKKAVRLFHAPKKFPKVQLFEFVVGN